MVCLADVVRRHGAAYLARHGPGVLPSHVRAMQAITRCRTAELGGHLAECPQCGKVHLLYHSCRHRACPECGHTATKRWVEGQRELLLPAAYFHVVFTLPSELRRLVRSHQKALLSVLMRTAFESLAALCADARFVGGQVGALAVLHTWTRTLEWHPHVHLLVPGGALAPDGRTWVGVKGRRKRFLVPVKALSKHFRGRFLHRARRALPREVFPDIPWGKRWVVFAKPVVQGPERVLEYLGRYVHRTALMGKAIVACDDESVTFTYRDSRDHQKKTMKLPGHEFLRRFLQHVPPKGFHRVRAFGLLHAAHRQTLARLQLLLAAPPAPCAAGEAVPSGTSKQRCPVCQQALLLVSGRLSPAECLAWALRQEARVDATARAPPSRVSLSPGAAAA